MPSVNVATSTAPWRLDLANERDTDTDLVDGPQGQRFVPIAGAELCGAQHLSAGRVRLAPDDQAVPHWHEEDRVVLIRAGHAATLIMAPDGQDWEFAVITGPGDLVVIPAGWIHQAVGLGIEPIRAVEISADARFNHSVHLRPDCDRPDVRAWLREEFFAGWLIPGAHTLPSG